MVKAPLEKAWQYLAQIEKWPSWAKHIKRVGVRPAGELGLKSTGIIHLSNGAKSTFIMTEFNLRRNWKWAGRLLWWTIHYNHLFEELPSEETMLVWTIEGEGFGISLFGRFFAKLYNRSLDKAIPLLIEEMNTRMDNRQFDRDPINGESALRRVQAT